jgi:hypothetical protein
MRLGRDVLAARPDLVIVEFAVNDLNGGQTKYGDAFEGMVRQLLDAPWHPAVILLFFTRYDLPISAPTDTAQPWQAAIGQHYNVPMVSYYSGLAPTIIDGYLQVSDIAANDFHPNDSGHAYAALFLETALQNADKGFPEGSGPNTSFPPAANAFHRKNFEFVSLSEGIGDMGLALCPSANTGWTPSAASGSLLSSEPEGYEASVPGSSLDFQVYGTDVFLGYWASPGAMGRAKVYVDGVQYPNVVDGWFNQARREETLVATGLHAANHQVHIELLSSKDPNSTGTTFRVLWLGVAGAFVIDDIGSAADALGQGRPQSPLTTQFADGGRPMAGMAQGCFCPPAATSIPCFNSLRIDARLSVAPRSLPGKLTTSMLPLSPQTPRDSHAN